jgi:glutamate racemase
VEGKIGFFDSGVGGISVLREAVRLLPQEQFVYYGDNANAPYGIKPEREILALTQNAIQSLMANYPLKALVIACNTATSAAQKRCAPAGHPVVGMEPALKPAHEHRSGGQIIVLATMQHCIRKNFIC